MSDNFSDFDNLVDLFTTIKSKLLEKAHIYVGTRDAWDQLTVKEKTAYQFTAFLGDTESGIVDDVPTQNSNNLVKSGGVYSQYETLETAISDEATARANADAQKADKSDLASISITGSTNNTGSTITSGTFFYKSGVLVQAILDIANGATLTKNTNYKEISAGGLNEIPPKKLKVQSTDITLSFSNESNKTGTKAAPTVDGYTPIAIAGWYNVNYTACAVQTLYLSNTTINLMAARLNNQSWSGSYTLRVFVLYQSN